MEYRLNGFILSQINYHILQLKTEGGQGLFYGKISKFVKQKTKDQAEVKVETNILSIQRVLFFNMTQKIRPECLQKFPKREELQVLGYFTFRKERPEFISLQQIENAQKIRFECEQLAKTQKDLCQPNQFVVGIFTLHSLQKMENASQSLNYDTNNLQRFSSRFYRLQKRGDLGNIFAPVDISLTNIKNTDFNPDDNSEEKYVDSYEFVPQVFQHLQKSLELMRNYVKTQVNELNKRKKLLRDSQSKLCLAYSQQKSLLEKEILMKQQSPSPGGHHHHQQHHHHHPSSKKQERKA